MPNLYALLGLGLVLMGLLGFGGYEYQRAEAQTAKVDTAHLETKAQASLVAQYRQDLGEAQADADHAAQRTRDLDNQVKERDARIKVLDEAKRKISDDFYKLAKQASQPSKDCLASGLSPSMAEWLRDDGDSAGADKNADGSGKGSGESH